MRECAVLAVLSVALAVAVPSRAVADTAPGESGIAALSYVGETQLSPRLREITLRTSAVITPPLGPMPGNTTGQTKVRVLLPEEYDRNARARYPVLYLYHGGGGNQATWTTPASAGDAEALTRGLPLIVVMPEGGVGGGYADWYNGGKFGPPRWKTYHLDQLIPWIDAHFRTIADRGGRATAGLSMGGGGLRYAALRPDLIGATAAFSGDIDILQPASDWNGMGAPISRMIWGDRKTEEVRWRGVNGPDLAKNLGNTDVTIFTGDTGHPEGVYILQGSTAVHDRLAALGIRHQFVLQPGMSHSWPTWNQALGRWLPHLMSRFRTFNPGNPVLRTAAKLSRRGPAAHPVAFSYSTIESAYSVHGWSVRMERAVVEFSALEAAGPRVFTLFGSGTAVVTTPVVGKPNAVMRASIGNSHRTITARTDAQGRLTLPIELGPANRFQQYSSEADQAATGTQPDPVPFRLLNDGSRFFQVRVTLAPMPRSR